MTAEVDSGDNELVWYAGYGSNLLADRFAAYMVGAPAPNSPGQVAESGARDPSPPRAEWAGEIDLDIVFAGQSTKWGGGGVAFVDPTVGSGSCFVRAYLVTVGQLEDLHRQESRSDGVRAVDLDRLVSERSVRLHEGWYSDLIVGAMHDDGRPIVVVGAPEHPPLAPPDISYLRTMATGLATDFGLTTGEIVDYLCTRRGAAGELDPTWLTDALSSI